MYLYIHNSNLFSLLSHFDFLFISFKGLLQTFCLPLSENTFSFFQKWVNISPGSAVSDSELHASSESLLDIATVTKGCGLAKGHLGHIWKYYLDRHISLQPAKLA